MPSRLPTVIRQGALPLAAAVVVFFSNLGGIALWDEDEPKNAVCAREMFERGDWIVPTFNGQLRTDKPILLYWLMLVAYHALGATELAARVWSAILCSVTVGLTCDMGRRLGPEGTGPWSGLVLASGLLFGVIARAATPDATFVACTTLAFWALVCFSEAFRTPVPRTSWWLIHASLALAALAKGPSGVLLPLVVMVLCLAWRESQAGGGLGVPRRLWRAAWSMRPLLGGLVISLVALPWYIAVGMKTEGAWPAGFLGYHNVQRFLGPLENHSGPIVYYLPAILAGMFPWSLWLPAALWEPVRRIRSAGTDASDVFLLAWVGVYVAVFSLAGTKLPTYVLPCYPALAILIGRKVAALTRASSASINPWPFRILALTGVAIGAASGVATRWSPELLWLGLIGLIPLAGGILGEWWARRARPHWAYGTFAAATVALMAVLLGGAADVLDDYQTHATFARQIQRSGNGTPAVATLEAFRPTVVYYSGKIITDCPSASDAARFLLDHPTGYLIVRDDHWGDLKPLLPQGHEVLARGEVFLRRHQILLIGPRPAEPVASTRR